MAARQGGGSPEFTESGAPGVETTRGWVGEDQRDTLDYSRATARLDGALGSGFYGGNGSARRRHAGVATFWHLGHTLVYNT